ncbi:metallophosphoesterase family protein [Haloarcula sp. GH36]|uniref:metallophosphoesterase family protein n=1 Tax=Haloarcula montana TaxID=3111776 RepID=UPI002D76C5D8|nr:hypothetical protein [Haloarcula sp. GH36]
MTRTIGLLYDPHIVEGDRDGYDGVPTVEAAIDKLNDLSVDWTVLGGDLRHLLGAANQYNFDRTDWGGWHGDPDNYFYHRDFERAKTIFDERLESDYFVARGNNDRPLDVYREYFPADEFPQWGWFTEDEARYVILDTNPHLGYHSLRDQQNFVSAPQISMLERLMDDDAEIPTFVFLHAPVAKHEGIDSWDTGPNAAYSLTLNYPTVQRVLERGNTVFVNSGHYWRDTGRNVEEVNGVQYVLARHLVHNRDPDYGGDVRWMRVNTNERTASVHYYDVGADEEGMLTRAEW